MRVLTIVFFFISYISLAQQDDKKGTVHVKKVPVVRTDTNTFSFEGPVNVVVWPSYRGGDPAIKKFISSNIRFPKVITEKKAQGTCYTRFMVSQQGKVSDISVVKGVSGCTECDEEAIRLIEAMGPWIPGSRNDIKQALEYDLQIEFRIK
jgi:TonB family protein